MWREHRVAWLSGERSALFSSTSHAQSLPTRQQNLLYKMEAREDRQPGLWRRTAFDSSKTEPPTSFLSPQPARAYPRMIELSYKPTPRKTEPASYGTPNHVSTTSRIPKWISRYTDQSPSTSKVVTASYAEPKPTTPNAVIPNDVKAVPANPLAPTRRSKPVVSYIDVGLNGQNGGTTPNKSDFVGVHKDPEEPPKGILHATRFFEPDVDKKGVDEAKYRVPTEPTVPKEHQDALAITMGGANDSTLTVQLVDEIEPHAFSKVTNKWGAVTHETTADDGATSDPLATLRDLEVPLNSSLGYSGDENVVETARTPIKHISTVIGNPFTIFRLKHARSAVNVTEEDLAALKATMFAKRHSPDDLLSCFKASISVTNIPMMDIILRFLCDVMRSDVSQRELCVRMMETALVYHPDELVRCFSCTYIPFMFDPELNDDVGGSFMRLLLSYKATFVAPGITDDSLPVCVDRRGRLCYNIEESDPADRYYVAHRNRKIDTFGEASDDVSGTNTTSDAPSGLDYIGCGKIESMVLLKICADRAKVESVFDIPASRLRDWLCTIWFELPATRPCLPLMRLCIHWIDSREDSTFLKDAAFALVQKELSLLGEFQGGRLVMLELLSFMVERNGDASAELSKIVDIVAEGEENTLYAIMDSIVSYNLLESDMLDLWCLLCILPWPVASPTSAICRLLSSTFLIFYQIAYDAIKSGSGQDRFSSPPMALLENALRICTCRCSSPVLAKGALMQTIMLVELSPLPALKMKNAPLILSSLSPFLWKCYFVWSNCGRDVDPDNLTALRHLYDSLRRCVFCEPLSSADRNITTRTLPMFPRIRFTTNEGDEDDVNISNFIGTTTQVISTVSAPEPEEEFDYSYAPQEDSAVDDVPNVLPLEQPRGIRNLGNTCYYNSLLQALFHTRSFVKGLFDLSSSNTTVAVYQRLFRKLLKRGKKPFDPNPGYKLLPAAWRQNSEQQDVTEVLSHLLESLDESLELWRRLFAGMVVRRIKCLHCGNMSDNREIVMDFTFTVDNMSSIQAMFDDFCKIENLRGGNRYLCAKCDAHRRADMWNVIASPPAHLMVVLSRHMWSPVAALQGSSGGASKLLNHVHVDEQLRICEFDYTLYGTIFHSGTGASSGHYYFVGRDSEAPSNWHVCDDSQVRPATAATVNEISKDRGNSHVPYVVFYRCSQAPLTEL
ncbi:ubiquitin carboxyl-terminal hydrolase family protein, putative [Babesia bigemina]|uniref:Ubiquitin carboxyl-terminal hydrolase family protein, putative n=1 Tax=Babesia bigemina TaxID=5866 RepID=A0A061D6S5_BABBI|nr:ubiquitin carboxyl-terminal hydrolase family protein, putative [Babesia bigemina]CDR96396.1 ubiquitin carboxyl-terminal hydrolase family protein, putative [Babesia bigemina]|eukprot:XP_012768582.1 ubiquitin carboxyl-terminal hydrolase family protein, putative [Babesia bigemina]